MSTFEKEIIDLIVAQDENDQVDFKKEYYSKEKKYDLIKDIVSFANNTKPRNKYIVFGVENYSWIPTGINASTLPDISEINDLLHIFKKEKANLLNYNNIGTYAKLIQEFECDLDSTSLVPIALAKKYTTITLEPGGKVLDLLAKNALN